ncbi:hypothetical protein TIFTF001_032236 [Ficus carica]|uniref:Fe2OG dioxygenase domain-containing protein n=1 Tax=Ficus carica TaxID=3494 RepID=A0AA88DX42_FICCA|nr:hypothetical protein TIFTF001_032236 [Ficus carica]
MDSEPPFEETYKTLLQNSLNTMEVKGTDKFDIVEDCNLPLANLIHIRSDDQLERESCIREIVEAARNWGFFQVVNHGISIQELETLKIEQKKVFQQPFEKKIQNKFLNLSSNGYRWGNQKATCLKQFSWSEAFHLSVKDISSMTECNNLRLTMERFARAASGLAETLVEILAENVGVKFTYFQENCPPSSSFLRLNRYPPCPFSSSELVCGLIPHTDTDFLSVVYQDRIGGLQLLKDGRWFGVKPNPEALIINIGDLFQALSNGVYKSVKHRVVATQFERFSAAYFYCPANEAMVESHGQPAIYRKFSFKEYKQQSQKDVEETGSKVGLQRFLL